MSRAGLVPIMALAQRGGLPGLAAGHVRISRPAGMNAGLKVFSVFSGDKPLTVAVSPTSWRSANEDGAPRCLS